MICNTCQRETNPFGELDPRFGVVEKCGHMDCKAPMSRGVPAPVPQAALALAEPTRARVIASPVAMRAQDGAERRERTLPVQSTTGASILEMARARLCVVESQIAEMKFLLEEEKLLRRMLRADAAQDDSATTAPN